MKTLKWPLEKTLYVIDEIIEKHNTLIDFKDLKTNIANDIGVSRASLVMAIANLKYILSDGNKGLSAYTTRQEEAVKLTLEKHNLSQQRLFNILD